MTSSAVRGHGARAGEGDVTTWRSARTPLTLATAPEIKMERVTLGSKWTKLAHWCMYTYPHRLISHMSGTWALVAAVCWKTWGDQNYPRASVEHTHSRGKLQSNEACAIEMIRDWARQMAENRHDGERGQCTRASGVVAASDRFKIDFHVFSFACLVS